MGSAPSATSPDTWTLATADGLRLHVTVWKPHGPARAVIALVHGLGSHAQRLAPAALALCGAGYLVAGLDLRGFGHSEGRRGHTPSLEAYGDDLAGFLAELSRRWPGLPQVLYGHSMGAVLVLAFTLMRHPSLAGVIATATSLRSQVADQRLKVLLVRLLGRLLPTLPLHNGLDLSRLSRDPAVQAGVEADPLCHRTVTTAWGRALLRAIALVQAGAAAFPLPLLLLHGTEDTIADPEGSRRFAAAVPAGLVTLQLFPGFRHELHNEPGREQVFARMIGWLDQLLEPPDDHPRP
jgi:alpha-beta hydrolase superfamily lysophospholipase